MSITPWQTRWDTLGIPKDTAIQGEIDELRAALQERAAAKPPAVLMNQLVNDKLELSAKLAERDAEIQRQYACIASHARITQAAEGKVEAQRKVLEQALEALEHILRCIGYGTATIHFDSMTWRQSDAAITAIQEVLS